LLGDCSDTADVLPAGSLALVYLDPPFGTGRAQPYRFGLSAGQRPLADPAGGDSWWLRWRPRFLATFERLRAGGVFVLHLDPRSAPLARVGLDAEFGPDSFLNEIVWHYRTGGIARDRLPSKHDTLLIYRKGSGHTFHALLEKRYLAHRASRKGVEEHRDAHGWYRFARVDDVWQVPVLPTDSRERLGYPTQKPEALVVRILETFTNPGDQVADLTSGSGTLLAAAHRSGRRWICGDSDPRAVLCALGRLARILSIDLQKEWDARRVASRRADLGCRIARWQQDPALWGLTDGERRALATAGYSFPAGSPSFQEPR
jgi:hypothetical protein